MMKEKSEANILSYRILFDDTGKLIMELSGLPLKDASRIFSGHDLKVIETIIREGREKIRKLHQSMENEINAIKT